VQLDVTVAPPFDASQLVIEQVLLLPPFEQVFVLHEFLPQPHEQLLLLHQLPHELLAQLLHQPEPQLLPQMFLQLLLQPLPPEDVPLMV